MKKIVDIEILNNTLNIHVIMEYSVSYTQYLENDF